MKRFCVPWTEYKPTGEPEGRQLRGFFDVLELWTENKKIQLENINTNNKTTLFISVCFTYFTQPVFHKLFSLVHIMILSLKGNGKDL